MKKLYKSRTDKMLSGVLGGVAQYFGIDSTIVRLIVAFLGLMSCGTVVLAYIIAALIIPVEP